MAVITCSPESGPVSGTLCTLGFLGSVLALPWNILECTHEGTSHTDSDKLVILHIITLSKHAHISEDSRSQVQVHSGTKVGGTSGLELLFSLAQPLVQVTESLGVGSTRSFFDDLKQVSLINFLYYD